MQKQEILPLLKKLHISIPREGNSIITIKQKEDDPDTIVVLIRNNERTHSYSWIRFPLGDTITLTIELENGDLKEEQ
jgi:hypothetical protein